MEGRKWVLKEINFGKCELNTVGINDYNKKKD
jgi:hypothetical protein